MFFLKVLNPFIVTFLISLFVFSHAHSMTAEDELTTAVQASPSPSLSMWETLDTFQYTLTRSDIEASLQILNQDQVLIPNQNDAIRQNQAKDYIDQYIQVSDDSVKVTRVPGHFELENLEYTFPLLLPGQAIAPESTCFHGSELLTRYKIVIDGNNRTPNPEGAAVAEKTRRVAIAVAQTLREAGANNVVVTPVCNETECGSFIAFRKSVLEKIKAEEPQVLIAIRSQSGGAGQQNTFSIFCPGCFMREWNELGTELERYRFMYALVSGKLWHSIQLAAHIAASVRDSGLENLHSPMQDGLFRDAHAHNCACGIAKGLNRLVDQTADTLMLVEEPSQTFTGVLTRNFYINGLNTFMNLWINSGNSFVRDDISVEQIAHIYCRGILSYLQEQRL